MKRFFSVLLAVLLIVSTCSTAFADNVIPIPENTFRPLLNVASETKIPELKAGEKVTLTLPIKNNSLQRR